MTSASRLNSMWLRSAETSLGLHGSKTRNVHQNIYSCGLSVAQCSNQSTYHVAQVEQGREVVEQGRAHLRRCDSGHTMLDALLNHENL